MKDLDLSTIYKAILATGWLITDEKGLVYRNLSISNEEKEPFLMLEKQVALPTRENLGRCGQDNLLIFHPLMEGLMGGESPVIGKLRRAYGIRFAYTAGTLFKELLGGATATTEYSKFSPEQMDLLTVIKGVDAGTLKTWDKLLELSVEQHGMSNAFVDVYIKREQTLSGVPMSRVASVRFPIYEELAKDNGKIFNSKMKPSVKDRSVIMKMFEYVFPGIAMADAYTVGTNSRIAPYLDALLGVYGKLFKITNALYDKFNDVIVFDPAIQVELDWPEWFRDIECLKNLAQSVPQQFGNYPIKVEDEKRSETGTHGQPATVPQRTQPATPQPVQHAVHVQPAQQAAVQQVQQPVQMEPAPAPKEEPFRGIGVPINGANGMIQPPKISTQAVFVDGAQTARALLDPVTASVTDALRVTRAGGVGRVAATNTVPVQQPAATFVGTQPLNGGNVNANGWNTTNSNSFGQQNNSVATSLLVREAALQNLMGSGSPFGGTIGNFQTRSSI